MPFRRVIQVGLLAAVAAALVPAAGAYIHFPPPTLQKMCDISRQVRALKVERVSPDGEVVLFAVEEELKGKQELCPPGKHVLRGDTAKTTREALKPGTKAVFFWIEGRGNVDGSTLGCGYVFLDCLCYSVDYNTEGKHWTFIRHDPELNGTYYGPPDQLRGLVRDVLAGRKVEVPVKAADRGDTKAEWEKRFKEVNDVLRKNRNLPPD